MAKLSVEVFCRDCRCWHPVGVPGTGQCRAEPPRLEPPLHELDRRTDLERTKFPLTAAGDWCAQHRPARAPS